MNYDICVRCGNPPSLCLSDCPSITDRDEFIEYAIECLDAYESTLKAIAGSPKDITGGAKFQAMANKVLRRTRLLK